MERSDKPLYRIAAVLSIIVPFVGAGCTTAPSAAQYPQQSCTAYTHAKKQFTARVNWCIRYVEVRNDVMEVRVSWEVVKLQGNVNTIFQITDKDNRNMYLLDEFGNRYDHNLVSGAAGGVVHDQGSVQIGTFFFSPPTGAARNFRFHDDDNGVALEIRL